MVLQVSYFGFKANLSTDSSEGQKPCFERFEHISQTTLSSDLNFFLQVEDASHGSQREFQIILTIHQLPLKVNNKMRLILHP